MKLSDYVVDFLVQRGIRHAFVVQGGAVAHLIDSAARHPDMEYICPAHEQAAAMAVDGYIRVNGQLACAMATTGPGVTNLMTGIACLYYDSLPGIFIAGQVSTFRLHTNVPGVRQLGFQESPHVDLVRPITKYAVLVDDPARIRYELEKAFHIATSGRPGPVFIDICDNVQRAEIDPAALEGFTAPAEPAAGGTLDGQVQQILDLLAKAERPVVVLGAAVKLAGCVSQAMQLIRRLDVPVAPTWACTDLFAWDDPLNTGSFGISGTRRGNFAVQNADFVLSIGSRLDTHATGTPINGFAREARKVVVEIDPSELAKFAQGGLAIDVPVLADVRDFLAAMERRWNSIAVKDISSWRARILEWRRQYPSCPPAFKAQRGTVNPYAFCDALAEAAPDDAVIIPDCGANLIQTFQGYRLRAGQKLFSAFNNSPMGYSLSGAIGACFANGRKPVICITGDGGLQVNLQELGTIARYELPIKIFLFNNHGYGIIQQTQEDWLDARYHGARPEFGLMDPDYCRIAETFGIKALTVQDHSGMATAIAEVLAHDGPILCNLEFDSYQRIDSFLKAGRPIEDPNPLLPREEFLKNMIVKPLEASRRA